MTTPAASLGNYSYVVYSAMGQAALDEISLSNVSFSRGMDGAETMQGKMSLSDPKANPILIQTLSREICVFRNGFPQFMGPITGLEFSLSDNTVQITCAGIWWYFTRMSNELAYNPVNVDVATVVWNLLSTAQGKVPGGDRRLLQGTYPASTGQLVTHTYSNVDSNYVASFVNDLANQYPGFDFDISLRTVTGSQTINRYFNMYAPLKGNVIDQPISNGVGDSSFSFTEDGTAVTSRVTELSGSDAASTFVIRKNAAALVAGSIPMVETINTRQDADLTTLSLYADGELYLHKWPVRSYNASYHPSAALPYGFCTLGDYVQIDMAVGNWSITDTKRVVAINTSVADSGDETITLTFNEIGAL